MVIAATCCRHDEGKCCCNYWNESSRNHDVSYQSAHPRARSGYLDIGRFARVREGVRLRGLPRFRSVRSRSVLAVQMALVSAALAGCSTDSDDSSDAGASGAGGAIPDGMGTLALRFAMDADYIPDLDLEPTGTFRGTVFPGDGVTASGPDEGLEGLLSITVEDIDLAGGGPTGVLHVTEPLPAMVVAVLGFLDEDKNTDAAVPGPDTHDPVTFPNTNRFEVVAGEETEVEVYFGLLYP